MHVNDLLIRCQELQDQGAGDRTVCDEGGNKVIGLQLDSGRGAVLIRETSDDPDAPEVGDEETPAT